MAEPEIETSEAVASPVSDCDAGLHYPLALNAENKIICHRCGYVYVKEKPKPAVKRVKDKTKKMKKSSPKRRG